MPKACRASYTMALEIKVIAEAEAERKQLGNSARLWSKRVHGGTLEKRLGDYSYWRA